MITTTTTTKPYPTKWGRLHGSNYAIVFYHKPNLSPTKFKHLWHGPNSIIWWL